MATADARHNYKKSSNLLKHSLVINLVFALVFCAIMVGGSSLLHHMGQAPAVADLAQPYLWLIALSLIPSMLFQTFREYTKGLSCTKEAMDINLLCSLLNMEDLAIFFFSF